MATPHLWSRRDALLGCAGAVASTSMMSVASSARAADGADRRFIFVHCIGGWDPFMVFAPVFDDPRIGPDAGAEPANALDINYVAHPDRPSVSAFFDNWAAHATLINGIESPSVNHATCTRLMFTGDGASGTDDGGTILAHHATDAPLLPMVVLSGPWYARTHADVVVPVGSRGQLAALLDGSATAEADVPVAPPSTAVGDLLNAATTSRISRLLSSATDDQVRTVLSAARDARLRQDTLLASVADLDLGRTDILAEDLSRAADLLEAGLSRCVRLGYRGFDGTGFDTHSLNFRQSPSFEELFAALDTLLADLALRDGHAGGSLLDETVVVVTSEMGRHPQINAREGREHWTWTSALVAGGGIVGGQTLGGWTADMTGQPLDPSTGLVREGGETLSASHLGATLLALGDVDPTAAGLNFGPLGALLR
jgi:uncharacterized protein (DUF1501 family)